MALGFSPTIISARATSVLRYHSKTLQLLGIEPRRSPSSVQAVARAEDRIGRALLDSVREWHELENACRLLLEHSNDDPP